MYTLGGGIHEEQGWGRADETFAVKEELAAYGVGPEWFGLGDRDFATHIVRTQMIGAGYPLSAVTEALCARWQPGVAAAAHDGRPRRDPRPDRRPGRPGRREP
ncbi:Phosphoenolpyruvate transferase [Streptomyces antimycoticus]